MSGKRKDENKQSNRCRLFSFVARSHVFFQSSGTHRRMNINNAIEKLQRLAREKEALKSGTQMEIKGGRRSVEKIKMLRRRENVGVLNIQLLAVRSSVHSLSYLECEKGKQYHEKM
jgi:hypothetical protein